MPFEPNKPPNNPFGGPSFDKGPAPNPKKEDKPAWAQDLPPMPLGPWEAPHKDFGQFDLLKPPLIQALDNTPMPNGGMWNPTFDPALDFPNQGDWNNPSVTPPYKDYPTETQANMDYWNWYVDHGPGSVPQYEIDGRHYWDPWDANDPNRPPAPPGGHNPPPATMPGERPIETQYYDDELHQAPKLFPGMPWKNPFLPQIPQLPPRNAG